MMEVKLEPVLFNSKIQYPHYPPPHICDAVSTKPQSYTDRCVWQAGVWEGREK